MSEIFVTDIANGNTVENKIAILLNGAGTSQNNPILRGLGMDIDFKFSPNVIDFEIRFGRLSPADERILATEAIDSVIHRVSGVAGVGDLGFNVDYTVAQRHFIRATIISGGALQGTERQFWVKEPPEILAYLCGAQLAWCDQAAKAYEPPLPPPPSQTGNSPGRLIPDPGAPPVGDTGDPDMGLSPNAPSDAFARILLGPGHVVNFGIYVDSPAVPINIPIDIMPNWKDEFNIKHYGGAKYLSVFEDGLNEGVQGAYVTQRYQDDITQVTSIQLLTVDSSHEYRLIFRFRSELNDVHYVDYLVRFRVLTVDDLTRLKLNYGPIYPSQLPEIIYYEPTQRFRWATWPPGSGPLNEFIPDYVEFIIDTNVVSLPTDTITDFPVSFSDLKGIIYGGEIKIVFRRSIGLFTDAILATYKIVRPNGPNQLPITVQPLIVRRGGYTANSLWSPDTQFRLMSPVAPDGKVYLEVLSVNTDYIFATLWTEKGAMNLSLPMRSGTLYDVTDLFDVDPVTYIVKQSVYNVLLMTDNNIRVYQERPVTVRQHLEVRNPAITTSAPYDDYVLPVTTRNYPNASIMFPPLTVQGNIYTIMNQDALDPATPTNRVWVYGRNGIKAIDDILFGMPVPFLLSDICSPGEDMFVIFYSILHSFGVSHYRVNVPTWEGYDGVPPPLTNTGLLQLILYGQRVVLTRIPANLFNITITGNLGSVVYTRADVVENREIDIGDYYDGIFPHILVSYIVYNPSTQTFDSYGPFTIPKIPGLIGVPTTEIQFNPLVLNSQRLLETAARMPRSKISIKEKTITFNYSGIPTSRFTRWSVASALNGIVIDFNSAPVNLTVYDIRRLFLQERKRRLESGQYVIVTFRHESGAHKTAMYKVTGNFEKPIILTNLTG